MSIKYQIVYGDGTTSQRNQESCFGKLNDFNGQVEWSNFKDPREHDGLVGVKYMPDERWDNRAAAKAYWEYLLTKPLWADIVLNKDDGVDAMLDDGVIVSVETSPFHMLNTLSIFRHVYKFAYGVKLFKALIDVGCNPDIAFIASAVLELHDGNQIIPRRAEDGEHTVICHRTMTADDYLAYLTTHQVKPPVSKKDSKQTYQVARKYVRGGVATWFTASDKRTTQKDTALLMNSMLPSTYNVMYDKEEKVVKSCNACPVEIKLDAVQVLADHLNKLHDSIAS